MTHVESEIYKKLIALDNASLEAISNAESWELFKDLALHSPHERIRTTCTFIREHLKAKNVNFDYVRGMIQSISQFCVPRTDEIVLTGALINHSRQTSAIVSELINGAQNELLICTYIFNHLDDLSQLIKTASNRGVNIKLIVDRANNENHYLNAIDERENVEIRVMNQEDLTLHAKFIISDKSKVLISSANITSRAMTRNFELGYLSDHTKHVLSVIEFFESIWNHEKSISFSQFTQN